MTDGTARIRRNNAISAMAATMVAPAAVASERNRTSIRLLDAFFVRPEPGSLLGDLDMDDDSPPAVGLVAVDEPSADTSGCTVMAYSIRKSR
ncbi:hypothetical protein [Nocardia sp. NPDC057353]|uniref:hypothetical protein n=1 Tax=Nocardia sp. NPDC057353 TaxID=3346104 RepID=UPI00362A41AF